jgi:YidC/Oxa1 family membrane protein insertase
VEAFFDFLADVLAFFYSLVPNYAVAIILLTLVVMVVVTPLTLKGTRSMMVMQQLQPEMRKIQTKYKDDRQKLNEELLKFYKENNINPLGGCLPLLVQAPIFIVLYQVLRGLTRRVSDLGFDVGWITGQVGLGVQPGTAPEILRPFDPAYLNHESALYRSLEGRTEMMAFGMDLSESASQALQDTVVHALPYLVLIVLVGATGFIQQRQIQGRNPNANINPQQQMIMKIMPVFLPVISFGLPAGLVLYFAVSNLYRIGQQAFISRSIYGITRADRRAGRAGKGAAKSEVPPAPARDRGGRAEKKARQASPEKVPGTGGQRSRSGASGKGADGSRGEPRGRRTRSGSGHPGDASRGGNGRGGSPTLQPRARKPKKR